MECPKAELSGQQVCLPRVPQAAFIAALRRLNLPCSDERLAGHGQLTGGQRQVKFPAAVRERRRPAASIPVHAGGQHEGIGKAPGGSLTAGQFHCPPAARPGTIMVADICPGPGAVKLKLGSRREERVSLQPGDRPADETRAMVRIAAPIADQSPASFALAM